MTGASPREEASSWRSAGRAFAPLLVPALPPEVPFGLLGRLLPPGRSAELQLELHPLPTEASLRLLDRAAASAEAELADNPAREEVARRSEARRVATTAREIGRRIAGRDEALWRMGLTFLGLGPSTARAERARDDLARGLVGLGFGVRVPRYAARPAGAVPSGDAGEERPSGYWHVLHTDGVAAFFPFVEESVAEPDGVLVGLLLDDAGPVLVNRWAHASHSWGIFGTTGAGKTFAAALLALRSRWRDPALEVVILDPLGEFTGLAAALGGTVLRLGPGRPERLNPLDPATTGGDRAEKAGRVGAMLRALFPSLRDEEVATLDRAVRGLYDAGPAVPTFGDLLAEVERAPGEAGRLPTLLRVLTTGSLAHANGPTTVRLDRGPVVVTLDGVPEEQRAFHLAYVLEWVYGRLRSGGRRRLVLVDEAHFLVHQPGTAEFLDRVVRHVRHFDAGLLLLSQHPEDFLRGPAGRSILANLSASLLLRIASVSPEVAALFQLTASEVEWLPRARLAREAGYSEGLLRLGPAHLPIAVVASTPEYEFLSGVLATPPAGTGSGRAAPLSDAEGGTGSAHERR
jgi:hypothetical protein